MSDLSTINREFVNEYRGSHHGQKDFSLHLLINNKSVGYIDYSVYEDVPHIEMIKVPEKDNRRKGYATALIRHLQSLFPNTEINVGFTSVEGDKFFPTIPTRNVDNPEYHVKLARLKRLKTKVAEFQKKADEIYANHDFTDSNKQWFAKINDLWNRMHDRISDLEYGLHKMKPNKRIFEAESELPDIMDLYDILKNKYGEPIGDGKARWVFSNGRYVFKLPKNWDEGVRENSMEEHRWKTEKQDWIKYAKCRLVNVHGIPLLIMELVKPVTYGWKDLPDWTDFVDCRQVGHNRKGNLVAYDYGN